jgi:hypothetical protein
MSDQYSLPLGRAIRDKVLASVMENAGKDFGQRVEDVVFFYLPIGWEGSGEDIRRLCESEDIHPHHSNAWGGVINGLIRRGILHKTGRWTQMQDKRSHARMTQVLRR